MIAPLTTLADILAAGRERVWFLETDASLDDTHPEWRICHVLDATEDAWTLRAPRDAAAATKLADEARLLDLLRHRLGVAVPSRELSTPALVGDRVLPGISLATDGAGRLAPRSDTPEAHVSGLPAMFGRFLAALQTVSPDEPLASHVPRTTIDAERSWLARTMGEVRVALQPRDSLWARWQTWLADDRSWPAHVALAHGDLRAPHWRVDEAGLVSVSDWTEARFGDPTLDFAIATQALGEPALRTMVRAFEAAGGRTYPRFERHARERWAAQPVFIAARALQAGDDRALAIARERLAAASLS